MSTNSLSNYDLEEVGFNLIQPHSILVDPIRPRGLTAGGIEVIEDDEGWDQKTSMFLRVVALGPGCATAKLGSVYVCPVYCWDDMIGPDNEMWHIADERSLLVEVDNYDALGEELDWLN